MIREVRWEEDRDTLEDPMGNITGARVRWHVLWYGETSDECGGMTFRTERESLDKVYEFVGVRENWRMEENLNSGRATWRKLRP